MRDFQKLDQPQLVELQGELGFVIVTEIDVSEMKNSLLFMRGKAYNYENGELTETGIKEIQYSVNEGAYYNVDEK